MDTVAIVEVVLSLGMFVVAMVCLNQARSINDLESQVGILTRRLGDLERKMGPAKTTPARSE